MRTFLECLALALVARGMGVRVFAVGFCFGPDGEERWCGQCRTAGYVRCRDLRAGHQNGGDR